MLRPGLQSLAEELASHVTWVDVKHHRNKRGDAKKGPNQHEGNRQVPMMISSLFCISTFQDYLLGLESDKFALLQALFLPHQ